MGILTTKRLKEIIDKAKIKNYKTFIETGTYTGRSVIPLAQDFKDIEFHTIEIVEDLYLYAKKQAEQKKIKNINFYNGDSQKILEKLLHEIDLGEVIIFLDAHSSSYEGFSADTIEIDSEESLITKIKNYISKRKKTLSPNIQINQLSNKKNDNEESLITKIKNYISKRKKNIFINIKNNILKRKKNLSTNIRINQLSNTEVPLINELKIISKLNSSFLIIVDDYDLFGKKYDFADWSNIEESTIKEIFKNSDVIFYNFPKDGESDHQLIIEKLN